MKKESTKEKILSAAQKLFVENGFSGTSMGKIAKLANVNHSLIFHHFENKEKLWIAVKQGIVRDYTQGSRVLPSADLPFADFVQELIRRSIDFYRENPDIIRMIGWQRLEQDQEQIIGLTVSAESQAWIDTLNHYKEKGDINPALNVEFIFILILSITSSAALDKNVFIQSNTNKEAYISFCVECLQKALR